MIDLYASLQEYIYFLAVILIPTIFSLVLLVVTAYTLKKL